MFGKWFGRKKQSEDQMMQDIWNASVRLQTEYWRLDRNELSVLQARPIESLATSELIRLHHLACMELMETPRVRRALESQDLDDDDEHVSPAGPAILSQIAARLCGDSGLCRPRFAGVFQAPVEGDREPDFAGFLLNGSLTHFGMLEALRVNEEQMPVELHFIPFDEVSACVMAGRSLLKPGRIFFEYGREPESFWFPALYGVSHNSKRELHRNGGITTFHAHQTVPGLAMQTGIGLGHQDFFLREAGENGSGRMFGIGSVSQIQFSVDPADPRFDEKCRGRGHDPDEVRRYLEAADDSASG